MSTRNPWVPGPSGCAGLLLGCVMVLGVGGPVRSDVSSPAAESRTFVGSIAGAPPSARIGLVVTDDAFLAYVCSQDEEFNKASAAWFKGAVKGGRIDATAGGRHLIATVAAGKVTGQLTGGGTALTFAAAEASPDGVAAVVRAEDADGPDEYVLGWIVDEEGNVAGAVGRKGGNNTGTLRGGGVLDGLRDRAKDKLDDVRGQRVRDPKDPPKGKKSKADPKRRQAFLDGLKARSGNQGNPATAIVLNQARRVLANQQPANDLEQRTFARLRKIPRAVLQDFVKNFDALPAATRTAMEGPTGRELGTRPLSVDVVKGFEARLKALPGANVRTRAAGTPRGALRISNVEVREVRCNERTGVELDLSRGDEVFVIYTMVTGDASPVQQTGVVKGLKDRTTKAFNDRDRRVFPPTDQLSLVANQDLFITAHLFEDDSNVDAVKALLKGMWDVTIIALGVTFSPFSAGVTAALIPATIIAANLMLDSLFAGIKDAQPLGEDTIVVRLNGDTEDLAGNRKTKFEFKSARKGAGDFDFELRDMKVKN